MFSYCSFLQNNSPHYKPPQKKKTVNEILDTKSDYSKSISIIDNIIELKPINNIVEDNVFKDLEIFDGLEDKNNNIFNILDNTKTIFGKIYFKHILNSPTNNIETLKNRQNILNKIDKNLLESITKKLDVLKSLESDIIWILKDKTNEESKLINSVYFTNNFLQLLNYNEDVLTLYSLFKIIFAPLYGVISPIVLFLLPYLYIQFFTKIKFDFGIYMKIFKMSMFGGFNMLTSNSKFNMTKYFSVILSFIIYIQNLMNTLEISKNTNKIINTLHNKINKLQEFMETSHLLFKETKDVFKRQDIEIFNKIINDELFKHPPSLLSNKGKILTTYRLINNLKELKEKYKYYFNYIGEIDMYNGITLFMNDINNKKLDVCYSKYLDNHTPTININKLWHPSLIDKNSINNSINIGNNNPNNIILTGPNAGGKSTFIKSISISLLLSQTIGIALSSKFEFTPFSLINTYLNIPDCKGKESLFEAEMHRAKKHIDKLNELDNKSFSFIVMDEIFSSTNPEEGISGAYAIANKLASYKNSVALITTHFSYLTNLEKSEHFTNYNIPIERDETNQIKYTYKLKKGSSSQYIALELLKNKGFDTELVASAQDICKQLTHKTQAEPVTEPAEPSEPVAEPSEPALAPGKHASKARVPEFGGGGGSLFNTHIYAYIHIHVHVQCKGSFLHMKRGGKHACFLCRGNAAETTRVIIFLRFYYKLI